MLVQDFKLLEPLRNAYSLEFFVSFLFQDMIE